MPWQTVAAVLLVCSFTASVGWVLGRDSERGRWKRVTRKEAPNAAVMLAVKRGLWFEPVGSAAYSSCKAMAAGFGLLEWAEEIETQREWQAWAWPGGN